MRAALMSIATVAICTLGATAASADDAVGVVVIGDANLQPRVTAYLEHWLETHNHNVMAAPMSADAINTITNCLVLDDQKCARGVVDARSKSDTVLFARTEVGKDKSIVINAFWFTKHHEVIGERRVCEHCAGDAWQVAADQMMDALTAQTVHTGHLHVDSEPQGMIVVFDNVEIGITPLDRDVPPGHHRVDLTHSGSHVGKRLVQIDANDTTNVLIKAKLDPPPEGSRLAPTIVLTSGIVAIGVGAVLLYYGSVGGSDQKRIYPDLTPAGLGVMAGGLGATAVGGVLFYQARTPASQPVAAVSRTGAYLGWITRF
jgi:hypothetical protein